VIGAVVAETEEQAIEARNKVQVLVENLEHQVVDSDLEFFKGRIGERDSGDVEKGFSESSVVSEGVYGLA
jgi:hypothetical protein